MTLVSVIVVWFVMSIPTALIVGRLMSINPRDDDT
jgi:hypothetical protein